MILCSVPGCGKKHNAKGFCGTHYAMLKKHGDPLYAAKGLHLESIGAPLNTLEDFWARVDKSGSCWLWLGGKDKDGYGWFSWNNKTVKTHRFVAEVVMGLKISQLVVCHSCDNPPCVNPNHLWAGTSQQNNADKVAKGRNVRRGEEFWNSKLTDEQVTAIRQLAQQTDVTHKQIAAQFGISRPQASNIIRGDSWKHLL